MSNFHIAQFNIARFQSPIDDPVNADFMAALDRVNAVADVQPGFVWRLAGEDDNATDIQAFDDPQVLVNMSVWRDIDALAQFVYRTPAHVEIMRQREKWFEKIETSYVLWWLPKCETPSVEVGRRRLQQLSERGPTPNAFTFKERFPPPDETTKS